MRFFQLFIETNQTDPYILSTFLTTACDVEDECLSLSNDRDENSLGVPISADFLPRSIDSKLEFISESELYDSLGLDIPESELLYSEGNMRSVLDLPVLR